MDKSRLLFQADVRNFRAENGEITFDETDSPIASLINFNFSQDLGASIPQDMTLESANEGIEHSFSITQDLFASGDRALINNKTYYYTAIAYAYNEYLEYAPDQVSDPGDMYAPSLNGQKTPFLSGRKNIKQYSVIPHITDAEAGGTILNAAYGTVPSMQRMEGIGNGGMVLEFTTETREALISDYCIPVTGYAMNGAPANIKVIDPLNVPENTEFTFKMDDSGNDASWFLVNTTTNDTVFSEQTIAVKNEQIIGDWGLSVTIQNGINPGDEGLDPNSSNGLLSVTQNKEAETVWLDYVRDTDDFFEIGETNFIFTSNWIRSGSDPIDHQTLDDGEAYESILNGSWAPYRLVGTDGQGGDFAHSPAWDSFQSLSALKDVPSVDIVFTDDESLWTRVPVIETGSG